MITKHLKNRGVYLSYLLLVLCMLTACKTEKPTNELEQTLLKISTKFSINHLSYLIYENGTITQEKYDNNPPEDLTEVDKKAFASLYIPLKFDHYLQESIINGEDTLNKTFKNIRNSNISFRDLTLLPSDTFEPTSFVADSVNMMMNTIMISKADDKNKAKKVLNDFEKESGIAGLNERGEKNFRKLAALSQYIVKSHPEYRAHQDTLVADLFPTWYTENKSLLLGWKILRLKNQVILWNFFNKATTGMLLMKFMNKDIFVSVSYSSKDIASPYAYNREDLLQSPIAVALIKKTLFPNDNKNDIPRPSAWVEQIKTIKNVDLRFLKVKELIAEARYLQHSGANQKASALFTGLSSITGDSIATNYINENAVADVGYVSNNLNTSAEFKVDSAGYYQIFSGGQVAAINDFNSMPYQYDNIQLYINDQGPRTVVKKENTRLFHFNYRFDKIAGMPDDRHQDSWLKATKIQFAYDDPSDSLYTLEVAIPWNEIRSDSQSKPGKIRLNILIGDSDYTENQRESILSWATRPGQDWSDPLTYGHLLLRRERLDAKDKIYSVKTKTPIIIDGQLEQKWNDVKFNPILNPYYGTVTSRDNSAVFKSLWDEKNLYFLFSVTDNCKNRTGLITKDRCWIEEISTNELIWKLPAEKGKDFPSHSVSQKIYLKPGKYVLRYLSDNKHSNEGWIGNAPQNYVYGGTIYKELKN